MQCALMLSTYVECHNVCLLYIYANIAVVSSHFSDVMIVVVNVM